MRYVLDLEQVPALGSSDVIMPLRDTVNKTCVNVEAWYKVINTIDHVLIFSDWLMENGFDNLAEGIRVTAQYKHIHLLKGESKYHIWDYGALVGVYRGLMLACLHSGAIISHRIEQYGSPFPDLVNGSERDLRAGENGFTLGKNWMLDNVVGHFRIWRDLRGNSPLIEEGTP